MTTEKLAAFITEDLTFTGADATDVEFVRRLFREPDSTTQCYLDILRDRGLDCSMLRKDDLPEVADMIKVPGTEQPPVGNHHANDG